MALWVSTGLIQVPLHARRVRAYNRRCLRLLVLSNWLRTVLWSTRGLLALSLLEA